MQTGSFESVSIHGDRVFANEIVSQGTWRTLAVGRALERDARVLDRPRLIGERLEVGDPLDVDGSERAAGRDRADALALADGLGHGLSRRR